MARCAARAQQPAWRGAASRQVNAVIREPGTTAALRLLYVRSSNWEAEEGLCIVQEMNRVAIGGNCEDTAQCSDDSVCLALQAGQPKSCQDLSAKQGGACRVQMGPRAARSRSQPEPSRRQLGSVRRSELDAECGVEFARCDPVRSEGRPEQR